MVRWVQIRAASHVGLGMFQFSLLALVNLSSLFIIIAKELAILLGFHKENSFLKLAVMLLIFISKISKLITSLLPVGGVIFCLFL